MPLVERLRERERRARGETEAAVRFALQAGEIVEQRRRLRGWPGFLGNGAGLSFTFRGDGPRPRFVPQTFRARIRVVVGFPELLVEPATAVIPARRAECAEHFPVVARREIADFFFAVDQDRERRRLNATDGRELKAARL